MSWESNYPAYVDPNPANTTLAGTRKLLKDVEVADIGCGFGGLLIGLAPILPDTLMVGTLSHPLDIPFDVWYKLTCLIKFQASKSDSKSQNTSKPASWLFATSRLDCAPPRPQRTTSRSQIPQSQTPQTKRTRICQKMPQPSQTPPNKPPPSCPADTKTSLRCAPTP
jgi:hypothetical protein